MKEITTIGIAAPGSKVPQVFDKMIQDYFTPRGINVKFFYEHNEKHPFSSDTNKARADFFLKALNDKEVDAIFVRGGYGCANILQYLPKKAPVQKPIIGFSDATALFCFIDKYWNIPVIHGQFISELTRPDQELCADELLDFLKGEFRAFQYQLKPRNELAKESAGIDGDIIGGNLSLIQTSIGTDFAPNLDGKILFLEEVSERGYRVDRMINHLMMAGYFDRVKAVIFGDFTGGHDIDGIDRVPLALESCAKTLNIPVYQVEHIGHSGINRALPFGVQAKIQDNILEVGNV